MLNFLPVFLILLTFIGLLVLRSLHVPLGMTWLILVIFSLLNWGALLLLRSNLPEALVFQHWFPLAISKDYFVLQIDSTNWLLVFALVSLVVGILFASSAHLQEQNIFSTWLQVLSLTIVGLLALMANSLLAFVFFWALLDIVEILFFTLINTQQNVSVQTYAIFIGRMLGLGLVILAMALPTGTPLPADLTTVTGTQLTLLIVGASLRLGVLPIHLPYTRDLLKRRSLSTILRVLAPLSTFSFLAKLAVPQTLTGVNLLIMLLAIVSSLFGSVNWLLAQNELEGRPYWILSFSGFAMISYLHGQSGSILVWGILMVIIGGWVFLSETNSRKMDFLLPVILLTLSGLPFTPAVAGLAGISTGPLLIFNPLLWVSLAILMAGVVKFSFSGGDSQHPYERWMRFFFSVGMSLMVLSSWSILLFKNLGWNQVRYWWVSLFVLTIFSGILVYTYVEKAYQEVQSSKAFAFIQLISPFGRVINRFFHFDWLYYLLGFFFRVQKKVVDGFNLVFEGEGGILWALVFLVLLASLLINGQGGQ